MIERAKIRETLPSILSSLYSIPDVKLGSHIYKILQSLRSTDSEEITVSAMNSIVIYVNLKARIVVKEAVTGQISSLHINDLKHGEILQEVIKRNLGDEAEPKGKCALLNYVQYFPPRVDKKLCTDLSKLDLLQQKREAAKLTLPIPKIHCLFGGHFSESRAVYLTGALEYVVSCILKRSLEAVRNSGRTIIVLKDVESVFEFLES
jgi:hypothetical protein